jgi:transcriptional regulator with XRE-family HTH domain
MANKTQLGGALRELRKEKGSSLVQVADATGISKSFLSLVESGRSDITIGRLLRLVSFYGANISDLLPPDDLHDATVVKRADQRELQSPAEGIRIFLLARNQDRKMTPSLGVIEPSGASAREQLVDHLVGETIADRFRELERLAAGRPLRSPSGLAPRPAGALIQINAGLRRHDAPSISSCLHSGSDTPSNIGRHLS